MPVITNISDKRAAPAKNELARLFFQDNRGEEAEIQCILLFGSGESGAERARTRLPHQTAVERFGRRILTSDEGRDMTATKSPVNAPATAPTDKQAKAAPARRDDVLNDLFCVRREPLEQARHAARVVEAENFRVLKSVLSVE